jgi:hypothetical protein
LALVRRTWFSPIPPQKGTHAMLCFILFFNGNDYKEIPHCDVFESFLSSSLVSPVKPQKALEHLRECFYARLTLLPLPHVSTNWRALWTLRDLFSIWDVLAQEKSKS